LTDFTFRFPFLYSGAAKKPTETIFFRILLNPKKYMVRAGVLYPEQSLQMSFLKKAAVLFPLIAVYTGMLFFNINRDVNTALKLTAFVYMVIYILVSRKLPVNVWYAFLLFLPFFIYAFYISFNWHAAFEDGLRYLFPVVVLFYGYSVRKYLPLLVRFMAVFIVMNFLMQLVNYYFWLQGVDQWFYYKTWRGVPYYIATSGIIRATGLITDFDLFGFLNLTGFLLVKSYYQGKYKKLILGLAALNVILSLSYKIIGAALILLVVSNLQKLHKVLTAGLILLILFTAFFPEKVEQIRQDLRYRVETYITKGRSARSDSYIIMFKQIGKGNLFGYGIGTFGGPASTKYQSPYFKKFGFNWYGMRWLTTTDTYPPHPFVELGLIGGLVYFFTILSPLIRRKVPVIILYLYFILFVDMLFTFSLNNLAFLLASLLFVYPVLEYHDKAR
jgi:hypothetical protein